MFANISFSEPVILVSHGGQDGKKWPLLSRALAEKMHHLSWRIQPLALCAIPAQIIDSIGLIIRSAFVMTIVNCIRIHDGFKNATGFKNKFTWVLLGIFTQTLTIAITPLIMAMQIIVQLGHILRSVLVTCVGFCASNSQAFNRIAQIEKNKKAHHVAFSNQESTAPRKVQATPTKTILVNRRVNQCWNWVGKLFEKDFVLNAIIMGDVEELKSFANISELAVINTDNAHLHRNTILNEIKGHYQFDSSRNVHDISVKKDDAKVCFPYFKSIIRAFIIYACAKQPPYIPQKASEAEENNQAEKDQDNFGKNLLKAVEAFYLMVDATFTEENRETIQAIIKYYRALNLQKVSASELYGIDDSEDESQLQAHEWLILNVLS